MADPEFLTETDLDNLVTARAVDQMFDDDGNGERDAAPLAFAMVRAEHDMLAMLLRGWSHAAAVTLCTEDVGLRSHVAWVALHYGTEHKPEFQNADGEGRFSAQYKRAVDHVDRLVKARLQSVGEEEAGQNAQVTNIKALPTLQQGELRFVFSGTTSNPRGSGYF